MNDPEVIIRKKVLNWYEEKGRDFPWRHTKDPYVIMIAEFMLHRTRAEQVLPVYQEFIKKYPDVKSLEAAKPEKIERVTRHLGLHWRARHFKESAKFIMDTFDGLFPEEEKQLRKIPGIGEYIAGAILTICFNKPAKPVVSNIARFINRFYTLNLEGEIRRKRTILERANTLFKHDDPGRFLFGLVDFTSLICKPQKPVCDSCPLGRYCGYNT